MDVDGSGTGTGEAPTLHPLLRDRRSVQSYDAEHRLSPGELRVLLEAARWAPSAGNSQPWAFVVGLRGDAVHDRLVPLLRPSVRRWAPAASALLVTLHRVASGPEGDAPTYSDYALHDLGQAVAHLTVQASALGLAVHQFAALDHDGVAAAFDVPRQWRVTTGVAVGVAVASQTWPRERRRLEEVALGAGLGAQPGFWQ